jgi:capsule polysaccharide modification protein KpsS
MKLVNDTNTTVEINGLGACEFIAITKLEEMAVLHLENMMDSIDIIIDINADITIQTIEKGAFDPNWVTVEQTNVKSLKESDFDLMCFINQKLGQHKIGFSFTF